MRRFFLGFLTLLALASCSTPSIQGDDLKQDQDSEQSKQQREPIFRHCGRCER